MKITVTPQKGYKITATSTPKRYTVAVRRPAGIKITVSTVQRVINEGGGTGGYEHIQGDPSSIWTINHNLGYKPGGIIVQDTANGHWYPEVVSHPTVNQTIINWGLPSFGGKAWLS